jgi:hypothetical protein
MRRVDAARLRRDLRQRDDFVRLRVEAGDVAQAGAHPERPFAHRLRDHRLHPRELARRRRAIRRSHHRAANRIVSGEKRDVDSERLPLERIEIRAERPRAAAVGPAECQSHTLHRRALRLRNVHHRIEVRVQIDEPRRDDQPARIDDPLRVRAE